MEPQKARHIRIDCGDLGQNGESGEVDLVGEIDFDISGMTLESGGTSEGQVRTDLLGDLGQNGESGKVDLGVEIDFDISVMTLESGGTSEGQVRTD